MTTPIKKTDLKNRNLPLTKDYPEAEIDLIKNALGEISPSSDDSAEFFNEGLPEKHPARVSRQTVWYWTTGGYRVKESTLRTWKAFPPEDARHQLALRIFALREREAVSFEAHWVR